MSLQAKTEAFLADLVSEVSEIPRETISPEADFQEFGLDSRFVIAMNARLEEVFPGLPRTVFFEYPSIRAVVTYLIDEYGDTLRSMFGERAAATVASGARPQPQPAAKAGETEPRGGPTTSFDVDDLSALAMQIPLAETTRRPRSELVRDDEEIAIIGVAGRYPKARTIDELWRNLREGRDCVEPLPHERWSSDPSGPLLWGGYLDGVAEFDSLFFGLAPRVAETMDPQERLFLEVAWETIENAGYDPLRLAASATEPAPVGVFVGVMYGEYQVLGAELTLLGQPTLVSSSYASIPNRVSYFLNFSGPSMALDTMCSSSLTALHLACASLRSGECKMALVGGTNVTVHPNKYRLLEAGKYLASDGRCRSYGADGDGYVPAEAIGAVLLKPLGDALRDGDTIWGVVKGTSINHGGRARGYTTPNPSAQGAALTRALERAGVAPETLGYIEGHGTGTSLGDPIEIRGLEKAFGRLSEKIPIGSIKSNIGHAESAAGIAGLTKVLLQLRAGELAPSIHCEPPNPNIDFARAPVSVQRHVAPWSRKTVSADGVLREVPRRALLSAFGAGGSNAQVIIEEASRPRRARAIEPGPMLFVLSARSPERLRVYAQRVLDFLACQRHPDSAEARELLYDMCATAYFGRTAFDARAAFVVDSLRVLQQKLAIWIHRGGSALDVRAGASHDATPLIELARRWALGERVDPSPFFAAPWQRVAIPTYPFEQNRLWPTERLHGLERATPTATLVRDTAPAKPAPAVAPVKPVPSKVAPTAPAVVDVARPPVPVAAAASGPVSVAAVEDAIRELVSNLLRIPPEQLRSDTAFFDYGLESVTAVELAERINARFGVDITPTIFFEFKTLALFTQHLVQRYDLSGRVGGAGAPAPSAAEAHEPSAAGPAGARARGPSAAGPSIEELWSAAAGEGATAKVDVEVRSMPGIDGRTVEYAVLGEGTPLFVFGGLLATHDALTLNEDILSLAKDHTIVMVHPPGAGNSELAGGDLTLEFVVGQAARVREALALSPIRVFGYSFGGIVAQAFAASEAKHVESVVLGCTTSEPATVTQGMDLVAAEAARHPDGFRAFAAADMTKFPLYTRLSQVITPASLEYPSLPTLIVAGADDQYIPPYHAERLAQRMPRATVHVLEGAGHFLALSHGRELVALVRDFFRAPPRAAHEPRPLAPRSVALRPIEEGALRAVKAFMEEGEISSGADISPVAAQVGYLVHHVLGGGGRINSFFLPSGIEATDAALRFGRRRAKMRTGNEGRTLLFDPEGALRSHFEFLPSETLFPDLVFVTEPAELLASLRSDPTIATVYASAECDRATLAASIDECARRGAVSIVAETRARAGELVTPGLAKKPDIVVFDEALTGDALPFGVCAVRDLDRLGVWTRQPDEFTVRLPGSMMGPALVVVRETMLRRFADALPTETAQTMRSFVVDQEKTRQAHRLYVNPALLESLQAFGLAVRHRHADRSGYEVEREDGSSARVTNLYLITSSSFRGHAGTEVARTVLAPHDGSRDYFDELARRVPSVTGFRRVLPAASPATAVESALKLGLLAARKGSSLLVLEGSPVFTRLGSLVSAVDAASPLRALVETCGWSKIVSVDPFAADAAARVDAALGSGDVGFVWMETLQSDWGALRRIPEAVLASVERHRREKRILVGVDECYTSVGSGRLFHWEGHLGRPDIVTTCVGWTDCQLLAGYVLTSDEVVTSAAQRNKAVVDALETSSRCALTAHATLVWFDVLERDRVLPTIASTSRRFSSALEALAAESPLIERVWGEGLFWAIQLDLSGWPRFIRDWFSSFAWSECMRDPAAPVAFSMQPMTPACLRLEPRFDIPDDELEAAIGTLRRVLAKGVDGIVESVAADLEARGDARRAELFRGVLRGFSRA